MPSTDNPKKRSLMVNEDIDPDLKFRVTEAYKTLRTNLMLSLHKKGCKTIVVSSCFQEEGKSTTSANVALSLAQAGIKVLLIDIDLRKSRINRFFNVSNTPGLTNYLGGLTSLTEVIKKTSYENLDIIPGGVLVLNPSEALASDVMKEMLETVKNNYDFIVLDAPPLNVVSDALPIIKLSDGVLLVLKEGKSKHTDLVKTIKQIELIEAKIIGFVLNYSSEASKDSYHYKYNYAE